MKKHTKYFCPKCEKEVPHTEEQKCSHCGEEVYSVWSRFRLPRVGSRDWNKIREALKTSRSDHAINSNDLVKAIVGYIPIEGSGALHNLSHRQYKEQRIWLKLHKNRRFRLTP